MPEIETEVINRQSRVDVDLRRVRGFLRRLLAALGLTGCALNVGFVDDREIARLNARFRGQAKATDVLSFPSGEWPDSGFQIPESRFEIPDSRRVKARDGDSRLQISDWKKPAFLGDIVISAQTARRNARAEGHSTENEIRWLILHGVLHLCGFDHEQDHGEMMALELRLRERLRI